MCDICDRKCFGEILFEEDGMCAAEYIGDGYDVIVAYSDHHKMTRNEKDRVYLYIFENFRFVTIRWVNEDHTYCLIRIFNISDIC